MQYKINWIEDKGTYKKMSLEGHGPMVSIWPDCPLYAQATLAAVLEGEIVSKPSKDGKMTFYNFQVPRPQKDYSQGGATRSGAIKQAQETKAMYIEKAQASKEDSIRISSTFRDATLIALEMWKVDGGDFHNIWLKERRWLLDNWEPKESVDDHGGRYEDNVDPTL